MTAVVSQSARSSSAATTRPNQWSIIESFAP